MEHKLKRLSINLTEIETLLESDSRSQFTKNYHGTVRYAEDLFLKEHFSLSLPPNCTELKDYNLEYKITMESKAEKNDNIPTHHSHSEIKKSHFNSLLSKFGDKSEDKSISRNQKDIQRNQTYSVGGKKYKSPDFEVNPFTFDAPSNSSQIQKPVILSNNELNPEMKEVIPQTNENSIFLLSFLIYCIEYRELVDILNDSRNISMNNNIHINHTADYKNDRTQSPKKRIDDLKKTVESIPHSFTQEKEDMTFNESKNFELKSENPEQFSFSMEEIPSFAQTSRFVSISITIFFH